MKTRGATGAIIATVLLICGGLIGVFVPSALRSIAEAGVEGRTLQASVQDLEARHIPLKQLAADKEANHALAERLTALMPTTLDIDRLILQIDDLSRATAVSATSLITTDPTTQKQKSVQGPLPAGTKEVTFRINLIGSFPNIERFARELEQGSRLVGIHLVTLSLGGDGTVQAQIDGRALWKPQVTTPLTNDVLRVSPETRDRFAKPIGSIELPPNTTGRVDPFAAVGE